MSTFRPLTLIGNQYVAFVVKNHDKLLETYNEKFTVENPLIPFPIFCWMQFDIGFDKITQSYENDPYVAGFLMTATTEQIIETYKK